MHCYHCLKGDFDLQKQFKYFLLPASDPAEFRYFPRNGGGGMSHWVDHLVSTDDQFGGWKCHEREKERGQRDYNKEIVTRGVKISWWLKLTIFPFIVVACSVHLEPLKMNKFTASFGAWVLNILQVTIEFFSKSGRRSEMLLDLQYFFQHQACLPVPL